MISFDCCQAQFPFYAIADSLKSHHQQSHWRRCISTPKNALDHRRIVHKPWHYHNDRTSCMKPTLKFGESLSRRIHEVNKYLKDHCLYLFAQTICVRVKGVSIFYSVTESSSEKVRSETILLGNLETNLE
jgi:hypothetical protein